MNRKDYLMVSISYFLSTSMLNYNPISPFYSYKQLTVIFKCSQKTLVIIIIIIIIFWIIIINI